MYVHSYSTDTVVVRTYENSKFVCNLCVFDYVCTYNNMLRCSDRQLRTYGIARLQGNTRTSRACVSSEHTATYHGILQWH